jgi:uncharacterized protein involved in exopolysaccharide biosynthesis
MTSDDEIERLQNLANYWELMYLRAREGAQAANRGVERLRHGRDELAQELALADAHVDRLERENTELAKKVQRLSLRLLGEWGREPFRS